MEERTLFKIAIISSLIGLYVMIIVAERIDFSGSNIGSINKNMVGEKIKIKGIVQEKRKLANILILNVSDDSGSIKVVAYTKENANLDKKDIIEVEGAVKEYNNELEIQADLIRR